MTNIILASGSAIRAQILKNAGLDFDIKRPDLDENIIKKQCLSDGIPIPDIAMALAEAKTMEVAKSTDKIVIGSDQILEFEGQLFDKPANMAEAKTRLNDLQGKTHSLINATCAARNGRIIWRNTERPYLTMFPLTPAQLDIYFSNADPSILKSVGAYQIEGLGARLFERIEGDYFAVLGLSLAPLLSFLRQEGAVAF